MEHFLQHRKPPTAVLCSSTVMALGAIRAINQAGLKIGEDISLIAHDDVLPHAEAGKLLRAADDDALVAAGGGRRGSPQRLISRLKQDGEYPEQELWKTELIVRASTGPAPKS
jgi:LacI family transcriptional regulator